MQDAGRVGRVADDHQVGVVGDGAGSSANRRRGQHDLGDRVAGLLERGVRLGELRVHDDRAAPRPEPGDERERLGRAGGRQHLVARGRPWRAATAASRRVGAGVGGRRPVEAVAQGARPARPAAGRGTR